MPIRLADLAARLHGVKWSGDQAFTALCPAHQDSNSSFSARLAEDGKLLCKCFAGCGFPAIVAAFGLEERDFFPPKPAAGAGPSQKKRREAKPITLAELAAAKKFDIAWLREHGVEDFPAAKGPGVAIGYFREDQSQHPRLRRRTALRAKDGSDWVGPKDVPLIPYGLWLLSEARSRRFVVIVEGETDCWALWAHGWPALGLPGASNIRCLEKEHLRGLDKLYVTQESDKAGMAFPGNVAKRCKELGFAGEMLAIRMPGGAKDPCDLHIAGTFDHEFQWAFENAQPIEAAPQAPQRVDCIIAGSDLEARTQATFAAIAVANTGPELFSNSTELVLLQDGTAVPAGIPRLRQWLTAHINFQTYDRRANLVPMTPPEVLCQNIMVYRPAQLPHLTRVVRRPVFAADGRLIITPGYDAGSGLFYAPSRGMVDVKPGSDVASALALVADLICDFNFETPSDRAHFYAFLLQPIFRELIAGPTPIYRFEAPTPGTGKGRLFSLGAVIHGGYVFTTPHGNNEEEWGKSLLTHLRTNPEILLIDNCSDLNSDNLSAATTAWPTWTARALSTLDQLVVPVRTLWAATINNPQLREDVYRRTARIRILPGPGVENPSTRTNFRHYPLLGYLQDHLADFVSATLTLAVFAKEAMHPFMARTLGSYEEWARIMGGALEALGIKGFLDAPAGADLAHDREEIVWRQFVVLWQERYGSQWMRCKDLLTLAQETEMDLGKGNDRSQQSTLGRRLARSRGAIFGGFLLDARERHHTLEYRSVSVENT